MLGEWRSHKDYQRFVVSNLSSVSDKNALFEYEDIISKLYILNLDELKRIVSHLYSPIGRPSEVRPEIFRAFILANDLNIALDNLPDKLRYNSILRTPDLRRVLSLVLPHTTTLLTVSLSLMNVRKSKPKSGNRQRKSVKVKNFLPRIRVLSPNSLTESSTKTRVSTAAPKRNYKKFLRAFA
jgi:hypothetical protein